MLHFRSFRNTDIPGLVDVWNESFIGRGCSQLRNCSILERYLFSKPFFAADGLIVALEDDQRVGFAHAGFGPNLRETGLSHQSGVLCVIGVRPMFRRRGIGSELLSRCEDYLQTKGAANLFAGPMKPLAPFYFGLYGGADLPGFLASDEAAAPFLEYNGYVAGDTCLVFQRALDEQVNIVDARFPNLRKKYSLRVMPRATIGTWWQEALLGPIDPLEFRIEETLTGRVAARCEVYEMEAFSWRWGVPSVGVQNIAVHDDIRRQGIGRFLLAQLLRYLQEQYFGLVEVQVMERNQAGVKLLRSLGFEQVDFGRQYKQAH